MATLSLIATPAIVSAVLLSLALNVPLFVEQFPAIVDALMGRDQ